MQPSPEFRRQPLEFWANVRTISQKVGYTVRPRRQKGVPAQPGAIKVPTLAEVAASLGAISLRADHLVQADGKPTTLGKKVLGYFEYRADLLNRVVEPLLMDAVQAEALYEEVRKRVASTLPVRMNKQTGKERKPAFLTQLVNMLVAENLGGLPCDYDPQELTTVTRDRTPFRTLARRVDGAFPGPVDPVAVWEIKEYYFTTTFGSRVADSVYETLLDGMELEELDKALEFLAADPVDPRPTHIQHLLMVDAHHTWWVKGRSYLCRIVDMLHMGSVDEVLFGREVVTRLPEVVRGWVETYRGRGQTE